MFGAKRLNSRHQFSSVEELQFKSEGYINPLQAKVDNVRYDDEVGSLAPLLFEMSKEADNLHRLPQS